MKKIIFFIVFLTIALLGTANAILAQGNSQGYSKTEKVITLSSDEIVDKDYLAAGDRVEIYGTVNGDVYAAGGEVVIDGTVNGDVLVGGGLVVISGKVSQDVRVGGGQVVINGEIGRNLTIGAGNVDISGPAIIAGSLVAGAGNMNLGAPIGGDVVVGTGNLVISNTVGGDVKAGVGMLRLTSKARVDGDLTYWSDQKASISNEALVEGTITRKEPVSSFDEKEFEAAQKGFARALKGAGSVGRIISFLSTLVIGLLLLHFYPKYSPATVEVLKKRPWASFGLGFVVLFLTPILFAVLLITVIGIPMALILLAAYLIYIYLAKIFVILWLGMELFKRMERKLHLAQAFVLGLVIYTVIMMVPVLDDFTAFFTLLFGLGAMLISCKETYEAARKKEVI